MMDQMGERLALEFLERFWEDQDEGVTRSLAEYLTWYPDHQERIADEFLKATRAQDSGQGEPEPAEPREGMVGPYRLDRVLGSGGQGTVWLAHDEHLGRPVALKLLQGMPGSVADRMMRFRREAALASKLDHPGICRVYGTGLDQGLAWIAMQYIEGETLSIALGREAPGSDSGGDRTPASNAIRHVLRIFVKLARALDAAHSAGILHRDIKPGNIMVTAKGEPIILDFGVARSLEDDEAKDLSHTGDLFGTPAYMAPEQVAGAEARPDRRSDIYSLGVTLFEALTAKRPFDAPTREGVFRAILTKDAPDPRRINPSISRDLHAVIECAIEKDRDRRYRNASSFARDLEAVLEGRAISIKPLSWLGHSRRWVRRHPARASVAATLIVSVLVIGGLGGYLTASWPRIERQRIAERDQRVEGILEEALYQTHRGDLEAAIHKFRAALELDPQSVEGAAGLALALRSNRQLEEAVAALERCTDPAIEALRADLLEALGREEEARQASQRAVPATTPIGWYLEGLRSLALAESSSPEDHAEIHVALERAREHLLMAAQSSPRMRRVYVFQLANAVARHPERPDAELVARLLRESWPEDAMSWYWAGVVSVADPKSAVASYRRAIELDPKHAPARYYLAQALIRWGRDQEAIEVLLQYLQERSDSVAARSALAAALLRTGDGPAAMEHLKLLVEVNPSDQWAWSTLARAHAEAGDSANARAAFERGLAAGHNLAPLHIEYAVFLTSESDFVRAAEHLRASIQLEPQSIDYRRRLADLLLRRLGDAQAGLELLDEVLQIRPNDRIGNWMRGDALTYLGRHEEAILAYRAAGRTRPLVGAHVAQLAATLLRAGHRQKAIAELRDGLLRLPHDPHCLQYLAHLGRDEADLREPALAIYRELLAAHAKHPATPDLARLLVRLERPREAIEVYEKALGDRPNDRELSLALAELLIAPDGGSGRADWTRAEQILTKLVARSRRRSPEPLRALAMAQFRLGKISAAIESQRELTALIAKTPHAGIDRGEMQERLAGFIEAAKD